MKHIFLGLLTAVVTVLVLSSCINDDFTTSQNDVLSFSTDTVTLTL